MIQTRRALLLGLLAAAAPGPGLAAVPDAIGAYEAATGGHVGLFARNLRGGATLEWRADDRFVLCSTFKLSLAALVLRRIDRGQDRPDAPIGFTAADVPDWHAPVARAALPRGRLSVMEMARAAVVQSDNSCATLLLHRVGGPAAVTAFWRGIGDRDSRLDDGEPAVNRTPPGGVRDTTTPRAMADTLRRIVLEGVLSPPSRSRLADWMIDCRTGLNRLRAGLPPGWTVGDKTGNNGADAAADLAVAWPGRGGPILVAAYTRGGTPGPAQLDALFRAIGQAAAGLA